MRSRRFVVLLVVLLGVNLTLWLAPPGLALRKALVLQLFSSKLIRADVLEKTGDWRLDGGVITSVDSSQVTVREFDGRVQMIPLSTLTRVGYYGHRLPVTALAPRWQVVVTWPANGAAQSVDVVRIPRAKKLGLGAPVPSTFTLRKATVVQLFGTKAFIRADVLEKNGDWRLDRGVITAVNSSQVTLREGDGRIQSIPLSSTTRVAYFGNRLSVNALAPHWHVIVTWPANGAAESVDVERTAKARTGQSASPPPPVS